MVKANMDNYDSSNVGNYKTVQPGNYLVKVINVELLRTKNGDEMWGMKYEIIEQDSEFYGQWLFDNIVFSEKAMNRAKLILESFGIDVTGGEKEYNKDDLLGTIARVLVERTELYTNAKGEQKEKAVIAYDGYFLIDGAERKKAEDDDIPF